MHIPKTGGHTLRAVLSAVYGDALCPAENWSELAKVDVSKYRVFIGHFGYEQAHKTFGDADFITFLREPNERLLSLYHYLQRTGQISTSATPKEYLTKIAPGRGEEDQMCHYLADGRTIAFALATLHDCIFVGQFEDLEGEIHRLATVLNWPTVPPVPMLNTDDAEHPSLDDLSDDTRDVLRHVNEADSAIYQHAIDEIWSQV